MPADSSIYNMIRPAAQPEGPLDAYGKMLTIGNLMDQQGVNALQRRKMEQEFADDDAFRGAARTAGSDLQKLRDLLYQGGNPTKALSVDKMITDRDMAGAKLANERGEATVRNVRLLGGALVSAFGDPSDQNLASIFGTLRAAGLKTEDTERVFAQTPDPEKRRMMVRAFAFQTPDGLAAIKAIQPDVQMVDSGQQIIPTNKNALAGPIGPVAGAAVTQRVQDPNSIASNAVAIRGQNLTDARARETLAAGGRQYDQARGVVVDTRKNTADPVMVGGNEFGGGKPLGADPSKAREDLDSLRKEFSALPEVKNYKDVVPIINSAKSAPNTPAGDFALIYGVGKILDPGSVVREGEMSLVIKSGSPAERVNGYLQYLQGNGRLTPALRQQLNAMLDTRVSEMASSYNAAKGTYEGIAKNRGYNTDEIFSGIPALAQNTGAAPVSTPKPTQADIDAELRRRGIAR